MGIGNGLILRDRVLVGRSYKVGLSGLLMFRDFNSAVRNMYLVGIWDQEGFWNELLEY